MICVASLSLQAENWPMWRGAEGSGVTTEKNLPLKWSAAENIAWKTALPQRGNSTPIVWGDRIFLTQPLEKEQRRTLMCLDRRNGKLLWQRGIKYEIKEETHRTNPYCSESPATDGERVITMFGSAGVFCYDFDGKLLWKRTDLSPIEFEWGSAVSPVIHGNHVYIYRGPSPKAHLLALDKKTGETLWISNDPPVQTVGRTDGFKGNRDTTAWICSYATPLIIPHGKGKAILMTPPGRIRAHNPKDGKVLWNCEGLNPLVYCSPIYGENTVVAMGGFYGTSVAVTAGGLNDVTSTRRLWQTERTPNRLGSGVVYKGHIYVLNTAGILDCIELKTGKVLYSERVRGKGAKQESWSSMVLSESRMYIPNQSSETLVVEASPKFKVLAINPLDGALTNSSLAVSKGQFFLRTHKHLWCIGKK
ncbi:MAG: PQQ-binding-like beta-propeller repeat protein [Verrucomicrobiota bacterium]|nr:PQQ-binding-like beta-propeller repeat protein [Verrucomicrobiota bacterium]